MNDVFLSRKIQAKERNINFKNIVKFRANKNKERAGGENMKLEISLFKFKIVKKPEGVNPKYEKEDFPDNKLTVYKIPEDDLILVEKHKNKKVIS